MIEVLRFYCPQFERIEESEIKNRQQSIGWHSTLYDNQNFPIGSGCHRERDIARRIAVSEALERAVVQELFTQIPKPMLLDLYPSTSGFAAGFEINPTRLRAISEGVERWAWSQWIDRGCKMHSVSQSEIELTEVASHFCQIFDRVEFFKNKFEVNVYGENLHLQFGVAIGFRANGAFPGSRACSLSEDPWEHALIEAWRHFQIAKEKNLPLTPNGVYKDRVVFFSKNATRAISAIQKSQTKNLIWPAPKLRILERAATRMSNLCVWRALCHDFDGWHLGDEKRFVY